MSDENTNENNEQGKESINDPSKSEEDNQSSVQPKETISETDRVKKEREALKAENDAYEAEQLRAEKLRAERVRGGRAMAGTEHLTPEQELEKQASKEAKEIVDAFQ